MLRFGDGTPFPLDAGFLEVLVDAVSTSTAMLNATVQLEERQARAKQRQHEILEEAHRLEQFEHTVRLAAAAGGPVGGSAPTPADQATRRTVAAMQHAMRHSREQLKERAHSAAAQLGWAEAARQVESAAAGFFERHALPGTVWSWSWNATPNASRFDATARGARFTIDFDVERDVLWRAPIRISALVTGLVVPLPVGRWLRQPTLAPVRLDRCVLVGARSDPEGLSLVIQHRGGPSAGWWISVPRNGHASATAFDKKGRATATGMISPELWAELAATVELQIQARLRIRRARAVLLGGVALSLIEETTAAPRALLDELGPISRELRDRSRVPGELCVKRDITPGVREELFVPRAQLAACYASLPPKYRPLLDSIGVGRGLTEVLSELPGEAPSAPRPHPAPPARARPAPSPAPPLRARPTPPPLPRPTPPPVPATTAATAATIIEAITERRARPGPAPTAAPVPATTAVTSERHARPAPPPTAGPVPAITAVTSARHARSAPPPVPRRSAVHTPTAPVRSLRAIPVQPTVAVSGSTPRPRGREPTRAARHAAARLA